jgi:hypothetical protein
MADSLIWLVMSPSPVATLDPPGFLPSGARPWPGLALLSLPRSPAWPPTQQVDLMLVPRRAALARSGVLGQIYADTIAVAQACVKARAGLCEGRSRRRL